MIERNGIDGDALREHADAAGGRFFSNSTVGKPRNDAGFVTTNEYTDARTLYALLQQHWEESFRQLRQLCLELLARVSVGNTR